MFEKEQTDKSTASMQCEMLIDSMRYAPPELVNRISRTVDNDSSYDHRQTLVTIAMLSGERLQSTWRFYLIATIINYIILSGSLICVLIASITTGKSAWTYSFVGLSSTTFLSTLIWKPHSKLLTAAKELTGADTIARAATTLIDAIDKIPDERLRAKMAADAIEKMSKTTKADDTKLKENGCSEKDTS